MDPRAFPALIGAAAVVAIFPAAAQVRPFDAERLLADRFGFTAAELSAVRSGEAVAKLLPTKDSADVGVFAAARINAKADRLAHWFKDIAGFRKAAELGVSRRLSEPPQLSDFADLMLDDGELVALQACRPGNCDLRLGDKAIQQFQTGVDWTTAEAGARASLLMRQVLLGHAQAYLAGGDQALGAYHNDKTPRVLADEFRLILGQSQALYDLAPPLAGFLEGFPSARLPESEHFLYWAKGGPGPDASITLHQLVVYHAPDGDVFVVDKQLYASRYVDAALVVVSLAPAPDGAGFYALAGARARSSMLKGLVARMLRIRVEAVTRQTAEMYLNWIRGSMTR